MNRFPSKSTENMNAPTIILVATVCHLEVEYDELNTAKNLISSEVSDTNIFLVIYDYNPLFISSLFQDICLQQ